MSKYFIDSSNIKSIDYDYDSRILVVTFKSKTSYTYKAVEPEKVCRVMFSESVGSAFHHIIAKDYKGVKVER
ncbi:KTSC domain-containing protein [Candidatus Pacearchaeota archaeon]|nr:KTSC domain-containing protein [Candidatus Pacearchaeota archaeon]